MKSVKNPSDSLGAARMEDPKTLVGHVGWPSMFRGLFGSMMAPWASLRIGKDYLELTQKSQEPIVFFPSEVFVHVPPHIPMMWYTVKLHHHDPRYANPLIFHPEWSAGFREFKEALVRWGYTTPLPVSGKTASHPASEGASTFSAKTSLTFTCPHCQTVLRVTDHVAGQRGRCPGCHATLTAPQCPSSSKNSRKDAGPFYFSQTATSVRTPSPQRTGGVPPSTSATHHPLPPPLPLKARPSTKKYWRYLLVPIFLSCISVAGTVLSLIANYASGHNTEQILLAMHDLHVEQVQNIQIFEGSIPQHDPEDGLLRVLSHEELQTFVSALNVVTEGHPDHPAYRQEWMVEMTLTDGEMLRLLMRQDAKDTKFLHLEPQWVHGFSEVIVMKSEELYQFMAEYSHDP